MVPSSPPPPDDLGGSSPGADDIMPLVYEELRRIATGIMRNERSGHTLQPTALVNEAYLRLVEVDRMPWKDRTHFLTAAAGTIRRVLVDHARARQADKRGGAWQRVTLGGLPEAGNDSPLDLLALDDALVKLAELDAVAGRIVELRYFGGLTIQQTAEILGTGTTSVKQKWDFARTWLRRETGGRE